MEMEMYICICTYQLIATMPGRTTDDCRRRIMTLHQQGYNYTQIVDRFGEESLMIARSTVSNVVKGFLKNGKFGVSVKFVHIQKKVTAEQIEGLKDFLKFKRNWKMANTKQFILLKRDLSLTCSYTTFLRSKRILGYGCGKTRFVHLIR